ncbi:hypothetical protein GCM10009760_61150 [Kitasatospora kazusensis]|uniref:Uncharacterized protein n=1 Tax=Kitasatospora kazusensis TaxID=407974 RepID=A0ABP5M3I5_9ACTN
MEWTSRLKALNDAVEARNQAIAEVRLADAHVVELTAQAAADGAPGASLARVLARLQPLLAQDRPHVCGVSPVVPPVQPAPEPPSERGWPDGLERYTLQEAWARGLLPWKASTTRTYRARSIRRGIPFPEGVQDKTGTGHYTEEELRAWLAAWTAQAGSENLTLPQQQPVPEPEPEPPTVPESASAG